MNVYVIYRTSSCVQPPELMFRPRIQHYAVLPIHVATLPVHACISEYMLVIKSLSLHQLFSIFIVHIHVEPLQLH